MIDNIQTIFSLIGFIILFTFLSFIFSVFLTKKYNDKYHNLYSLFLNVSIKNIVLEAIVLANFLIVFYFIFNINSFSNLTIYLIIGVNILCFLLSLNLHIVLVNSIYNLISIGLLWLLNLLNNYLTYIVYEQEIVILKVLFIVMIVLYSLFVVVRETEILINKARRQA